MKITPISEEEERKRARRGAARQRRYDEEQWKPIVGWASGHIAKLLEGKTVHFRPRGHSMKGKIDSGSLVTVEPLDDKSKLRTGDIVLCKVHGREYLHLVKAITGKRYQIGNNRGGTNGWIRANGIFGLCIKVEK